jgi:hypothetical protein
MRFASSLIVLFCAIAQICRFAEAANHASAEKEWTMLVFLNGKNSLDEFGPVNINQMESVGSTDGINVVVQWASSANKKTQRLFIQKDQDTKNINSPVIQDMGSKVDMGDWNTVVDFVSWGVKNYPAKKYFLDIWDHGSGWHNDLQPRRCSGNASLNDISWDEETGSSISTVQLGKILDQSSKIMGHKVDLYASDACLMAMAEIADQLSDSVSVYAGSEETEPGLGWPYDKMLARWSADPSISAAQVSKILSEEYVKSFKSGDHATFSSLDVDGHMSEFNAAVKALGENIMNLDAGSLNKIVSLIGNAQAFDIQDYKDFFDFMALLDAAQLAIPKDVITRVRSLESSFVISSGATDYSRAHGVSLWIPSDSHSFQSYIEAYKQLKFHAHTNWGNVLSLLFSQDQA